MSDAKKKIIQLDSINERRPVSQLENSRFSYTKLSFSPDQKWEQ
jgi:hypothetical protein